jgi:hypothetical protein
MTKLKLCAFLFLLIILPACKPTTTSKPPSDKEIYNFFQEQLKQTAKASGFLNYKLTIDKLQQDTTVNKCTLRDRSAVPCYTLVINRTEYLDNYTGTYTTTYMGDVYHLYRNEYGKLAIIDHADGSVNTRQDLHPDATKSL